VSTKSAVVDIHPSVLPTELAEWPRDSTYPRCSSLAVGDDSARIIGGQSTFRQMRRVQCDVAARLAELDASGVGLQLVSTGARNQCDADGSAIPQLVAGVGGIQLHGIGMIHWNEQHKITSLQGNDPCPQGITSSGPADG
jgi:hypothetical protein